MSVTSDAVATRAVDRRGLRLALSSTAFALPVLVIDNLPRGAEAPASVVVEQPDAIVTDIAPRRLSTTFVTTTTSTVPTTSAPPTTVAVVEEPMAVAEAPPAPPAVPPAVVIEPVVEEPVVPEPVPEPAPLVANEQHGKATWYYWNPGECAHRTIAKGTIVTVTNVGTGATTTCVVTDRGPYGAGKIIDLDSTVFAQIASLDEGVIDVHITW